MQNINDLLSDALKVKPLVGDEKREFRLCIFGKIDPISGHPIRKPGHTLAPKDTIRDGASWKTIMNIVNWETITLAGGEERMQPVAGYLYFTDALPIICTAEDNDKYFYMMRHNKNRDNPLRNKKKPAVFYMVDEKRDMTIERNIFEYKIFAGGHLISSEEKDLIRLMNNLNQSGNQNLQLNPTLRGQALVKALQPLSQAFSTEILLYSGSPELVTRVVVDTAIAQAWIVFNEHEAKQQWEWIRMPGAPGPKKIVEVEAGDDPRKFLLSFLTTEKGSTHYAELKARHKEYYKVDFE